MVQELKCEIIVSGTVRAFAYSYRNASTDERQLAFEIGNQIFDIMGKQLKKLGLKPGFSKELREVAGPLHLSWTDTEHQPRDTLDLNWRFSFMSGRSFTGYIRCLPTTGAPDERRALVRTTALDIAGEIRAGAAPSRDCEVRTRNIEIAAVSVSAPAEAEVSHGDIERGVMSV